MHTLERPLPILLACFCLGIIMEQAFGGRMPCFFSATCAIMVISYLALVASYIWRNATIGTCSMLVLALAAGAVRTSFYDMQQQQATAQPTRYVEGVVTSEPVTRASNTSFLLHSTDGRSAAVTIWRDSTLANNDPKLGEPIKIHANIGKPTKRGNPDEFDYAHWLWVQGIHGTIQTEANDVLRPDDCNSILSHIPYIIKVRLHALRLREKLLSRLHALEMPSTATALLAAMTLGDRSAIPDDVKDLYGDVGASHLMALSGLHLGIIMALLLWFARRRMQQPYWRIPLCSALILAVWCFAFIAGLPTSLVRAALMTTIWIVTTAINRHTGPLHNLVLAITIMLLWHPAYLFDVGAQLSCASVGGIICGMDMLLAKCRKLILPVRLFAVSCFAQIATLPFVAYYFQTVSPYGALFNLLYVPLTTVLIYGTVLLLALTLIWPSAAALVSVVLAFGIDVQTYVMRFQTCLPAATLNVSLYEKAQPQLIVYNNRACPAMHIIYSHDKSYLLMPKPELGPSGLQDIRRSFWQRRLTAEPTVLNAKDYITVGDKHIMMLRHKRQDVTSGTNILWVCRGYYGSLWDVCASRNIKLMILDASLSDNLRSQFVSEAQHLDIACYDVKERGALRLRM